MKSNGRMTAIAVTAILSAISIAPAQEILTQPHVASKPFIDPLPQPPRPKRLPLQRPPIPASEPATIPNAGFAASSVFSSSAVTATATTTLTPPVSLSYSGSLPTLLIQTTGPNKGLESLISNIGSPASAVYGQTNGSGAGVTGYNSGTLGPAGKFEITDPTSAQPALLAKTTGLGPAISATNTSPTDARFRSPAIYAENMSGAGFAFAIQGIGRSVGVYGGTSDNDDSESVGLYGIATLGTGLNVFSLSGTGAQILSDSGLGAYISGGTYGLYAEGSGNAAIYANNSGSDGVGIYATSNSGAAGEFSGNVLITGKLTVGSTSYSSDNQLKQDVQPLDGKEVLDKVDGLAVTSWDYKSDPTRRHVGPMAQDFRAAFGLNGDDDTHINEVDIAGVSLAAIKELSSQLKAKDERIAKLESQLQNLTETLSARIALLELQSGSAATVARNAR